METDLLKVKTIIYQKQDFILKLSHTQKSTCIMTQTLI